MKWRWHRLHWWNHIGLILEQNLHVFKYVLTNCYNLVVVVSIFSLFLQLSTFLYSGFLSLRLMELCGASLYWKKCHNYQRFSSIFQSKKKFLVVIWSNDCRSRPVRQANTKLFFQYRLYLPLFRGQIAVKYNKCCKRLFCLIAIYCDFFMTPCVKRLF